MIVYINIFVRQPRHAVGASGKKVLRWSTICWTFLWGPLRATTSDAWKPRQAIYQRAMEIDNQDALQRKVELESRRLKEESGGEASGSGESFKVGVFDPTKSDAT